LFAKNKTHGLGKTSNKESRKNYSLDLRKLQVGVTRVYDSGTSLALSIFWLLKEGGGLAHGSGSNLDKSRGDKKTCPAGGKGKNYPCQACGIRWKARKRDGKLAVTEKDVYSQTLMAVTGAGLKHIFKKGA